MLEADSIVALVFGVALFVIAMIAAVKYLGPPLRDILRSREPAAMAKLLVGGIKLRNPDLVEKGIENRRIYAYLGDEIDRAREMYMEHVTSEGHLSLELSEGHFERALVEILAGGDCAALGLEDRPADRHARPR